MAQEEFEKIATEAASYTRGYIDGKRHEEIDMMGFMEKLLRNEKGEVINPSNEWERGYIYAMELVKNYVLTKVG